MLSNDGVTWKHYITGDSPLVSKIVTSFAFDSETGEVWIGTTNGLSRLQTPFTAPKENLSLLTGYPNPYEIDGSGRVFTITNLAEGTSIRIYNVAGALVKSFEPEEIRGGEHPWDGTDNSGILVSSGIYVYLAFTDGISASGKVAVIRQ